MASTINATTSSGIVATADNTGSLALQSAGTTSATFNTYGMGLGSATPSSGIGITFPAAQSASSDANTLDDYEEGTWTPNVYAAAGANPTFTSSGRYTKIGRTVTATAIVTFTSTAGSVGIYMDGVPFNAYSASALTGFGSETTTSRTLNVNPGNATTVLITRYDGVFYEASGYNYIITLVYSV